MSKVIENFKSFSNIPRCSKDTAQMAKFLEDYCDCHDFKFTKDEAGNIHAYKGKPEICLQSHYDMVCVGDAPNIKIYEDNGWLKAKNSTLGADNGIGIAIIMEMMKDFDNLEVLFTNDEEIGLCGAGRYESGIISPRLLNLDSEDDTKVTIGCAGGVDILCKMQITKTEKNGNIYKVELNGLPGGHSGNQIHENIPNAIKILAQFLGEKDCELVEFKGGERRNSIPCAASVIVICKDNLKDYKNIKVTYIGEKNVKVVNESEKILGILGSFSQGVRSFDTKLGLVNDSINLSLVINEDDFVEIEFFARSMSKDGIDRLKYETKTLAKGFGFDCRFQGETSPWKPEESDFSKIVLSELLKFRPQAKLSGIHAGLECGVLIDKMQGSITACSIGPNIIGPHSINEKCEISSCDLIEKVVRNIVKFYN